MGTHTRFCTFVAKRLSNKAKEIAKSFISMHGDKSSEKFVRRWNGLTKTLFLNDESKMLGCLRLKKDKEQELVWVLLALSGSQ